jgi:hypothetical protein
MAWCLDDWSSKNNPSWAKLSQSSGGKERASLLENHRQVRFVIQRATALPDNNKQGPSS